MVDPLLFDQWLGVVDDVYHHSFEDSKDILVWKWNKNNLFSTKSVYEFQTKEDSRKHFKHIWKAKIFIQNQNFHVFGGE